MVWARVACRLAESFLARFVFVMRAPVLVPRSFQLLMPADGTFPREKVELWSQLRLQETSPVNAMHFCAVALFAHHVRSLRG